MAARGSPSANNRSDSRAAETGSTWLTAEYRCMASEMCPAAVACNPSLRACASVGWPSPAEAGTRARSANQDGDARRCSDSTFTTLTATYGADRNPIITSAITAETCAARDEATEVEGIDLVSLGLLIILVP